MIQITKPPIEPECDEYDDIKFIYPEVREKIPIYMGVGFGM